MECVTNDLTAWRITRGHVHVRTARGSLRASAGEWLFLPSGYRRQEFSAEAALTSIAFQVYWPGSVRPVLDLRPWLLVRGNCVLDGLLETLELDTAEGSEYEWHYQNALCSIEELMRMDSWFRGWLAAAVGLWRTHLPELETSREVDGRVERAYEWLLTLPLDSAEVSMEGATEATGLSAGYLNRLFIEHYHQTLHGFHEQRRLHYAKQALAEPGARIKNVALDLGFIDLSRFSAWFRRLEQVSPREYSGYWRRRR